MLITKPWPNKNTGHYAQQFLPLSAVYASVEGEAGFLEKCDRAREFNLGYFLFLNLSVLQMARENFMYSFDGHELLMELN